MSFRERIRTVRLDPMALETRERRGCDSQALDEQFGTDRKERMLEETHGLGYLKRDAQGRWHHRNRRTGEVEPVTERQAQELVG
jgi:hypothetical protein